MLTEYRCAARVAWWLLRSASLLRGRSLPTVCRAASIPARITTSRLDVSRVVTIARRVSGLSLFSLPIFPRVCMRQSLALYRELTRMGYPVAIHFGVRRVGAGLFGHSWVTLDGVPIAEAHPVQQLTVT